MYYDNIQELIESAASADYPTVVSKQTLDQLEEYCQSNGETLDFNTRVTVYTVDIEEETYRVTLTDYHEAGFCEFEVFAFPAMRTWGSVAGIQNEDEIPF